MDVSLAEFGSFTLEWHALSARTGDPVYGRLADNFISSLAQRYPEQVGGSWWPPRADAHVLCTFPRRVP